MKNRERFKEQLATACKQDAFSVFFDQYIRPYYQCRSWAEWDVNDDYKLAILTTLWLDEEYQEPEVDWSKVEVDTPILVSADGNHWRHRYFACYKDGKCMSGLGGKTSWTASSYMHWMQAKLAEPQKPEHDSRVGCKFEHFESDQEPCKDCQHAHMDKYEPQE